MKWIGSTLLALAIGVLCAAQNVVAQSAPSFERFPNGGGATNTAAKPASHGGNEKVSPGDKVIFSVAEDPVVGATARQTFVDPRFNIHFPVCEGFSDEIIISAKDKTLAQIQQELKQKLDASYYKNATVTVEPGPQALQPGQIVITGPVRNNFISLLPGEHKMLLAAILQCGPSEFANLKKVKIMRINPTTGKLDETIVNVEAIEKDPTKDVPVYDEDRINIPEKNILFQ